ELEKEILGTDEYSKSAKMRVLWEEGLEVAEIARILGVHYSFAHRVIRRHEAYRNGLVEKKVTTSQRIRDMHDQGFKPKDIKTKLGIPGPFVYTVLKRYKEVNQSVESHRHSS